MNIIIELYENYFDAEPVLRSAIKDAKGMYMRYIPEEERESYCIEPKDADRDGHYLVAEEKDGECWFFKLSALISMSKGMDDDWKPVYLVKFLAEGAGEYFICRKTA